MFRSRFLKVPATLCLAALVSFATVSAKTPIIADWVGGKYAIVEVVDGDTVKVRIGKKAESVRILGIDTPEKYPTRTWYAECYGEEASVYAVRTLSGKTVRVSRDSTQDARDKYGRALANVFLPNGSLYAEKAALSGFAFRYVYAGKPTTYDARIKKAEASAKAKGLGVWKECGGERRPLRTGTGASGFPAPKAVPGKTAEPAAPVAVPVPSMAGFSCSLPKTKCAQMASCEEARFYLNSCGVSRLDGDKDGTPCEAICK